MNQQGARRIRHTYIRAAFAAILPGEDLIAYVDMLEELAAELLPDTSLQWDALYTIAKSIWWKRRRQLFVAARRAAAMFDPDQPSYDEPMVLIATYHTLLEETDEREIEATVGRLAKDLREHLLKLCPRGKSKTPKAWARAIARKIEKELLPAATRFGEPPAEVLMGRSAATMSDEMFMRDLEVEERLEALIDRAFQRFFKLKAVENQTPFTELRRSRPSGTDRTEATAKRSTPAGARA
jgi:hypothetical protein